MGTRYGGARTRRSIECAIIAVLASAALSSVEAQSVATVSGVVTDGRGAPIVEAHVGIDGMATTSMTDSLGRFRIVSVPVGAGTVRARRLGFSPATAPIVVASGGLNDVQIRLDALPTVLSPVPVRARGGDFTGRLAGYYDRLARRGGGQFLTRERIDQENARMLTHLLERVPGVTSTRIRGGGRGVRLRGRNCWPLIYMDGIPMPAGEVDLDAFPPNTLHGIELYLGSTGAPAKYTHVRNLNSCGTILLWSRGPDTDPIVATPRSSTHLEQLVAARAIFPADMVDTPAEPAGGQMLEVSYPQSLLASKIGGLVIAEFVVGIDGRVEQGTFGIVSSTHPLLTDAVRHAVTRASYVPAVRGGRPVRQLVQQPFEFLPASATGAGGGSGATVRNGR